MKHWWLRKVTFMLLILAAALVVFGGVTMALWNALVPELFHGPTLTFWQAVGVLALSHILLRGWSPMRPSHRWRHHHWKSPAGENAEGPPTDAHARFGAEFRRRCGWDPDMDTPAGPTGGTSTTA
jgi:hypothetical protein